LTQRIERQTRGAIKSSDQDRQSTDVLPLEIACLGVGQAEMDRHAEAKMIEGKI